ncbi:putative 3-beta hydroxysteroid dehydrogenase/isomerase family protein, partial [Rhypophila sp. PSN 637]
MADNNSIDDNPSLGPVLVTGGCGFIGYHLISGILAIEPGCKIHVLDINTSRNRHPGVTYHQCDISRSPDVNRVFALSQPTIIFHLACPDSMIPRPDNFHAVNVTGAQNLVNAALGTESVHALINTTTYSVVHDNVSNLFNADESLPVLEYPAQKRIYSLTKAQGDEIIRSANRLGGEEEGPSMLTVELRPATMFGPRDTIFLSKIIANAKAGKARFQIGKGENLHDFLYVGNYVDANILVARRLLRDYEKRIRGEGERVDGQVFNVTNNEPVLFWEFQRKIAAEVGITVRKEERVVVPVWIALLVAWVSEWFVWIVSFGKRQPIVTREAVRLTVITKTLSCEKIKKLGYRPRVGMEEGLKISGAWFRE